MLPPEPRLPQLVPLIERMSYVVVHAPRQTGKTTSLTAIARRLTAEGRFAAVLTSCEAAGGMGGDIGAAEDVILSVLRQKAERQLPAPVHPPPWPTRPAGARIYAALAAWSMHSPRPVVLVFDEIDALRDATLVSVLGQLRTAYDDRPHGAPWSAVLVGLRDVRDYTYGRASPGARPHLGSASPFNIKAASLSIDAFTDIDVAALLEQHTHETRQSFTDEAIARIIELTGGQPWLTNALAQKITDAPGLDPIASIEATHVDEAKERVIVERQTHLDSLAARLNEDRIRRIIAPLVAGAELTGDAYDDDASYVRDLGLITPTGPVRVANPIYGEIIVRVLAQPAEGNITAEPKRFVRPDGRLDLHLQITEFMAFWVQHGEVLTSCQAWHEVAPQLVLMAWLHRIVNGGGYIEREYGVGRGGIGLLIRWPYADVHGQRAWQREAIELKVWAPGRADPTPDGLAQLDRDLGRLGLASGLLAVFDRRADAPVIDIRTRLETATTPAGRAVTLLRA